MSLKSEALQEAEKIVRSIVADAVAYRRANPCRFALFHKIMQQKLQNARRPNGKHLVAWRARIARHRYWEMFYSARCEAQDAMLAAACGVCKETGSGTVT